MKIADMCVFYLGALTLTHPQRYWHCHIRSWGLGCNCRRTWGLPVEVSCGKQGAVFQRACPPAQRKVSNLFIFIMLICSRGFLSISSPGWAALWHFLISFVCVMPTPSPPAAGPAHRTTVCAVSSCGRASERNLLRLPSCPAFAFVATFRPQ